MSYLMPLPVRYLVSGRRQNTKEISAINKVHRVGQIIITERPVLVLGSRPAGQPNADRSPADRLPIRSAREVGIRAAWTLILGRLPIMLIPLWRDLSFGALCRPFALPSIAGATTVHDSYSESCAIHDRRCQSASRTTVTKAKRIRQRKVHLSHENVISNRCCCCSC